MFIQHVEQTAGDVKRSPAEVWGMWVSFSDMPSQDTWMLNEEGTGPKTYPSEEAAASDMRANSGSISKITEIYRRRFGGEIKWSPKKMS